MQVGKKIAVVVETIWYRQLVGVNFLTNAQIEDNPTDMLVGTTVSEEPNGIWLKPDQRYSPFSKSSLFIPWRFIWSAIVLGAEEEKQMLGFPRV
jgi:hypothetical protein